MTAPLKELSIHGFKSIRELNAFRLNSGVNVLIGANGSGKSNFVDFFRMLRAFVDEGFQAFVNDQGGGDGFFFNGPKATPRISAKLDCDDHYYQFELVPTAGGRIQIANECVVDIGGRGLRMMGGGTWESALSDWLEKYFMSWEAGKGEPFYIICRAIANWWVYHFHDTSGLAPMRREQSARDREHLRSDASNIAAYLHHLKDTAPGHYSLIRDHIRLIAPFFDDFLLRPETRNGDEKIRLEWRQRGSDFPFQPSQLSDGTLRFICLATALQQPAPPTTILIDEPELGLHPYAIAVLAQLIHAASKRSQVIVCTQSPQLLDHFDAEDIVVVNRQHGATTFQRLDPDALKDWLIDYSVGELWQKNVFRGGPAGD